MKKEWKDWFISKLYPVTGVAEYKDRKYSFKNLTAEEVPFHSEFKNYIESFSPLAQNSNFSLYHIHEWKEGSYFDQHIDDNFNRKWAYVCELQPSTCGTTLMVEDIPTKEGLFGSNTVHEVPPIQEGTRISLTVFGVNNKTAI